MATQNPIEQEGTYPLPEAQVDRFFFKLMVGYSNRQELHEILNRTTAGRDPQVTQVMTGDEIIGAQKLVRRVVMAPLVQDYAIRLSLATHPQGQFATDMVNKYVRWGSSPRGAQAATLAAKVKALLDGRFNTAFADVQAVYLPAMRHRILLNFEGEAEGINPDDVLHEVLERTPTAVEAAA
jgi:MoxR-like ATPase